MVGFAGGSVPQSRCGEDCAPGQFRLMTHDKCCWDCLTCNESGIKPNDSSCVYCAVGLRPNAHKNECVVIVPDTLKWTSPYALVPATFSAMGIVG